jgi:hypothetical protein
MKKNRSKHKTGEVQAHINTRYTGLLPVL